MKTIAVLLLMAAGLSEMASATVTYQYTSASPARDVSFTFAFSSNTLVLTLTNNLVTPSNMSVISTLSAVDFDVVGGLTGTLSSSVGTRIDHAGSAAAGSPNWTQVVANGFFTTALNGNNDDLLIGKPCAATTNYNCANASVTNGSHDPFANQTLVLTFNIQGATAASQVSNVRAYWGSDSDFGTFTDVSTTPEPSTWLMLSSGIGLLLAVSRRRPAKA